MGSRIFNKKLVFCATVISVREYNQERYHEYGKITFGNSSFTLGFIPLLAKAVLGVGQSKELTLHHTLSLDVFIHYVIYNNNIIIISAISFEGMLTMSLQHLKVLLFRTKHFS